jgi:hypothetical protein
MTYAFAYSVYLSLEYSYDMNNHFRCNLNLITVDRMIVTWVIREGIFSLTIVLIITRIVKFVTERRKVKLKLNHHTMKSYGGVEV